MYKIVIEQAYDHIDLEFLIYITRGMDFVDKWKGCIPWCISTTSFAVLINGCSMDFLSVSRGPHRDDPISPHLFILVMEVWL